MIKLLYQTVVALLLVLAIYLCIHSGICYCYCDYCFYYGYYCWECNYCYWREPASGLNILLQNDGYALFTTLQLGVPFEGAL